jgi:hypothetical protein
MFCFSHWFQVQCLFFQIQQSKVWKNQLFISQNYDWSLGIFSQHRDMYFFWLKENLGQLG